MRDRSRSISRRAILEQNWGAEHLPGHGAISIGLLQQHAGQGPKAEAALRQATEVIERTLGTEHPWFATCLTTQASLRAAAGDLDAAEALERRALAIMDTIEETSSARYAGLLNNLGDVYRQREDYPRAQELFERALAVTERLEGPESYHVSIDYQNLGIVARERKDYVRAIEYDTRALSIRERLVGADHPDVAPLLNNLANVQRATGRDAEALQTYFRALRIWEQARGPYFSNTLNVVGNIARTYASTGDMPNAIAFQRRADTIIERQLSLNLAVGSERQKLAFVDSVSGRTDRTVSLSLREAAGRPDASALAALVLLQRKGRVLDAMADVFAAAGRRVGDAGDQRLLDELRATIAQLARLAFGPPPTAHAEDRQKAIEELEAKEQRLEADLSAHSAEFRSQHQPVTLEAVQAAMPRGLRLIEFAIFHPFDPGAERNAEAYGPPRYAAYVVRRHAAPRGFDLGPAKAIDEAIAALREALRDPIRTDLKQRARTVDERVLQPIRASFGDATRLLISPDGDLNLVPFEAFVEEDGRYLIERYAMSYLTSGRDCPAASGLPAGTRRSSSSPIPCSAMVHRRYCAAGWNGGGGARDRRALPGSDTADGRQATKAAVERLQAPRILHIASHGFFLEKAVDNPLLRSGLALAGANLRTAAHEDGGILTALEASALNLWGTKLVTLSACDSGVGEVRNGEGVYGLRRAFVLAGSETLVMNLWPVSDAVSREAMVAYYAGLRAGLGRGDALRQAKLAMLKRSGRQHPFYWASFIQSGAWASLDGTS